MQHTLWIYWMENDYSKHFEEREIQDACDVMEEVKNASDILHHKLCNGEIRDYQVESRYYD